MPISVQALGDGYGQKGAPTISGAAPQPGTGVYSARPSSNVAPSERPVGDLRIGLKARLFKNAAFQFVAWIPFGDEDVFAGSSSFTYEPKLIYDLVATDSFTLTVNAGARLREGSLFYTQRTNRNGTLVREGDMDPATVSDPTQIIRQPRLFVGSEISAGLGLAYDLTENLGIGLDAHALIPLTKADDGECEGDCKNGDQTAEVIAGASYAITGGFAVTLGVGASVLTSAARSPTVRGVLGMSWTPAGSPGQRMVSRGDKDGDRLPDNIDLCADEPEDMDGFQDDDGCPELDNDLDGVLDAQDQCKDEPEDRDGHQDEDGCADPDNDADKVPDVNDRCPNDIEDMDGFDDDDGCPDEDNDGDSFVDAKDQCPNEAESVNNYQDQDGCPDVSPQGGPKLTATGIDLQGDTVDFVGNTDRLTAQATKVLDLVANIMRPAIAEAQARGNVFRIRIEVGVARGRNARLDQDLSDRRADAVRAYLASKGIGVANMDVAGTGSARLIDPRKPKDPRNNTVRFVRPQQ
jgi:hypothetical protein